MRILTESELRRELKSGSNKSYLFFGEEDYLKLRCSEAARAGCPEAEYTKIWGGDYVPGMLSDAIRAVPLFGSRKIIELRAVDFGSMKAAEVKSIHEEIALIPESSAYCTVIISPAADRFDAGYLPKRPSALLTKLAESLVPVNFARITPARLAEWVRKHFASGGIEISSELCALIVAITGQDMFALAGEVGKLTAYAKSRGGVLTREDLLRVCAGGGGETGSFALSDALLNRRRGGAMAALRSIIERGGLPVTAIGEVSRVFCDLLAVRTLLDAGYLPAEIAKKLKMHEYRAKLYCVAAKSYTRGGLTEITEMCARVDLRLKSVQGAGWGEIESVICAAVS